MNRVILVGRMTRDMEIRVIHGEGTDEEQKVGRFNLAVDSYSKKDRNSADFFSCVAWNKVADLIEKYAHKGDKVTIEGHLKPNNYEKDGVRVYSMDVVIERVDFMSKREMQNQTDQETNEFVPVENEADLPY